MSMLSENLFFCQNCKSPLSRSARVQLDKTGEVTPCEECGETCFDMYSSALLDLEEGSAPNYKNYSFHSRL